MSYETILFERRDQAAWITLNRPQSLNSFTARMHEELAAALQEVASDSALRSVVITGAGRGFCAGQDLNARRIEPGGEPLDLGATIDKAYNPLIRRLRSLPLPVIAAVNGVAAGAGANLALACDIVVAARSARFIQSFCKIGLVPDSGGTWILPRLIGHARATALTLLAEPVDAAKAESWGMIWKCVEDPELIPEATRLAQHFAQQPTRGLALIKQALLASQSNSLDAQLDVERDLQRIAGRTEDFQEGVKAFLEKRNPQFKGR